MQTFACFSAREVITEQKYPDFEQSISAGIRTALFVRDKACQEASQLQSRRCNSLRTMTDCCIQFLNMENLTRNYYYYYYYC